MAGKVNEEDLNEVRSRARIDDIVGSFVTLKPAGGGSLKGLCPFHDEKTPSFQVTPSRGLYYCFGCGEGGDVFTFLQKINNLSFTEAVEQLADRVGVQLRYADEYGTSHTQPGLRTRVLAANAEAAAFFAEALTLPEALPGRLMLDGRGFSREIAERFGVGWAPRDGRALGRYLKQKGFSEEELIKAGLMRPGGWDFFQGRILWPIRDSGASVLGFGARRIFDDDRMPAKYINTPETPVYKKSHVLYGLDLARQAIGKRQQAVVVEGYTDVMAAHLSGVDTAVASCGTAFGEEHAKLLMRLLGVVGERAEVIFTFDGDQAGQNAARKVFSLDQAFTMQTYVAVEPTGLDPCDLRLQKGEAAVRDLVARRIPLYSFIMRNVLNGYDLDRADQRLAALRAAAPLASSVRDKSQVVAFARDLAGWLGMPEAEVLAEVRKAASRRSQGREQVVVRSEPAAKQPSVVAFTMPDPHERSLAAQRDTCKLLLQAPLQFDVDWSGLSERHFSHPGYQAVIRAVRATGEPVDGPDWVVRVREAADSDAAVDLITALSVEPLLREPTPAYVDEHVASVMLGRLNHDIAEHKSKLQRTNPQEDFAEYARQQAALAKLERRRKDLQERIWG